MDAFEAANPGVDVTFNFGASSEVVQGINEGAPTDVFASADTKNMDKLVAGAGGYFAPIIRAYIRRADNVPEAFWDIGVRIEDDVLVTATLMGLVCLGKTHMSELAFSGLGLNPVTATAPCVNDPAAVAGGSSSGASRCARQDARTAGIVAAQPARTCASGRLNWPATATMPVSRRAARCWLPAGSARPSCWNTATPASPPWCWRKPALDHT